MCSEQVFTVEYTPDGSYSTYDDDGGRGDGSMSSYQSVSRFWRMTPIYNDDFWNDDEGKEGYRILTMTQSYFRQVPNFEYVNSNYPGKHKIYPTTLTVKNLFKRGKLRPDIIQT